MSQLLDPEVKEIMAQELMAAEARGDVELAQELRRIQAELIHNLDQMEVRLKEEGRLEGVLTLLSVLERSVEKEGA